MNISHFILICIFLLCGSSSPIFGQEDLQSEFDHFVRQEEATFDNRIKQMNKEFADYLKQQWKSFDTHVNEPILRDPDTPTIRREEAIPTPVESKTEQVDTEVLPLTPPIKESGLIRQLEQRAVLFFGQTLQIPFDRSYKISVSNAQESAVSLAWEQATEVNYTALQSTLKHYKKELNLNDWGYMLLVRKSVEAIYGSIYENKNIPFLTTFLLNQASYSARLGRVNGQLALLLEMKETIYSVPQLKCGNQTLSIFCDQPLTGSVKVFTYTRSFPPATDCISTHIPTLPLLEGTYLKQDLPHQWKGKTIPVEINKNLIDFLATIPQTELSVYGHSGTSRQIEKLAELLKEQLKGMDETEIVGLLLDFVQNTFDYQSDIQQFGCEKIFFPDEMLFYPYNDCEDRAILFCRLVKLVLGLPVALVDYPNHIAAAVKFTTDIPGTCYMSGKEKYTLCDPTYINARIGECMPQLEKTMAKLIKL